MTAKPWIAAMVAAVMAIAGRATRAEFMPEDVAGLELWLAADYGVYTNAGGIVTTWVDRVSAIAFHQTTASPTQPGVVTNWHHQTTALRFPAFVNGGLQCAAGSLSITNRQGRTLFLALNVSTLVGSNGEIFGSGTAQMVDFSNGFHTNRIRLRHNDNLLSSAGTITWGEPHIVVVRGADDGDLTAYLDGDAWLLAATGEDRYRFVFYPLNNVPVGVGWAGYNGRNYRGDLGELLLYDRGLDDAEVADVVNWLADRYAIAVSFGNPKPAPVVFNREDLVRIRPDGADLVAEFPVGVQADIAVFWSTNAGLGAVLGGWEGTNTIPSASMGLVSYVISNLAAETTYYWRCYATNSGGEAWAPSPQVFRTPAPIAVDPPRWTNGLVLHLEAGNVAYTNNAVVTWWPDSAGHCPPFTRDWGSANPQRFYASVPELNGHSAMGFWSSVPPQSRIPAMIAGRDRTLLLVVIPTVQAGNNEVFGLGTDSTVSLDTQQVRLRKGSAMLRTPAESLPATPHIVAVTDGAAQWPRTQVWINGTPQPVTYTEGFDEATRFFDYALNAAAYAGGTGFGATRSYRGYLAELLLYERVLTDYEHSLIGYVLKTKYAITAVYDVSKGTVLMVR